MKLIDKLTALLFGAEELEVTPIIEANMAEYRLEMMFGDGYEL